jgi:alpha,alpha-trehalose phosphorylase
MDIDDHHSNFHHGIHAANMAGTWLSVAYGFAGLSTGGGGLALAPYLPDGWEGYRFRLTFGGNLLEVSVHKHGCYIKQLEGGPLEIAVTNRTYKLNGKGDVAVCENTR